MTGTSNTPAAPATPVVYVTVAIDDVDVLVPAGTLIIRAAEQVGIEIPPIVLVLEAGGPNGWTRSYANLAGKYGFYFNVGNGSINQGVHGGSFQATYILYPKRFGAPEVLPVSATLRPWHGEHRLMRAADENLPKYKHDAQASESRNTLACAACWYELICRSL